MIPLNEQTIAILGRPNFACAGVARLLRILGHEIEERAENEQAHVIHWMLGLYETHGDAWRDEGDKILDGARKKLKEAGA